MFILTIHVRNLMRTAWDERASERFADEALRIYNNFGNAMHAVNVSGGQVANTITNNYGNAEGISEIVLEGKLGTSADLEMFHAFGCPVLTLKVVCRSIRPARIQKAFLCVEGQGILSPFEKGFGMSFAATVPGSSETMLVRFFYLQTGPEGSPIVLQQDQVARFVLPVLATPMGIYLDRPAEELSVRVELQDETEVTVCEGEVVSESIIDLIEISSNYECKPGFPPVEICVRCKAISMPDQSMAGQVNKNAVHFGVSPQDQDASIATSQPDLELSTLDWWDRPCGLARYTNMSQNSVPDCMYAAIAGAVSYLAGSAVWTPYRLFREYNRSDLKGVRFGVIDTALKPVFGRVERFQHTNGTTSRSLSPAEMREWIACGGIIILFLEASTPSGEALKVGQMFSLVASNATHFQVWDTRGFQGMLSDDEIVSGFKCPSGHELSRSDLEYSLLLLRKVV